MTIGTDIAELRAALDDSLAAITIHNNLFSTRSVTSKKRPDSNIEWKNACSLQSRCATAISDHASREKPILRVMHHFACTGGTLISKCLAAMPGAFVLSEVHPRSQLTEYKSVFAPSDISLLSRSAQIPKIDELCNDIFLASVHRVYQRVQTVGGTLVLRDHTHSDFCLGDSTALNSSIEVALKESFEIRSVITTRHPIDSYLSLQRNDWLDFSPPTLDEYAQRYLVFLSQFVDTEIVKYEDFCRSPQLTLKSICSVYEMSYDDQFERYFGIFNVSGDSGRKETDKIELRERREISEGVKAEAEQSEAYKELCNRLFYDVPPS